MFLCIGCSCFLKKSLRSPELEKRDLRQETTYTKVVYVGVNPCQEGRIDARDKWRLRLLLKRWLCVLIIDIDIVAHRHWRHIVGGLVGGHPDPERVGNDLCEQFKTNRGDKCR